ncbi:MAG TPA: polysaccharide deacetylase family protein [Candidatus Krumholzibacteria bacterium]|nr:polysaccharide deacetylase family protein [Candidatus Krumholzibacteria bacterium]
MRLRRLILKSIEFFGLHPYLRRRRHGALVLAYHGVEEQILDPRIQTVHVSLLRFEQQMKYLKENFEVISVDELEQRLAAGSGLDGNQAVITLDDGYRNNLQIAAPLLDSMDLPFSVFVCSLNVSDGHRLPTYLARSALYLTERPSCRIQALNQELPLHSLEEKDFSARYLVATLKSSAQPVVESMLSDLETLLPPERREEIDERFASDALMNWDEVRTLHQNGVIIASHGKQHCILHDEQELDLVKTEVRESKETLERELGSCKYFAYPNGGPADISKASVLEVERAGYAMGFTCIFGETRLDSPRPFLPRMDADVGFDTFKFFLNSAYRPR